MVLEQYGFNPEMGHKEVGGVKASLTSSGEFHFIMEQLEVDWKYSDALQGADYELIARILIKEIFRLHGLDVSFDAKPLQGVAGSGEHTHVNAVAYLKDGTKINLFAPEDMKKDFLSKFGWGACSEFSSTTILSIRSYLRQLMPLNGLLRALKHLRTVSHQSARMYRLLHATALYCLVSCALKTAATLQDLNFARRIRTQTHICVWQPSISQCLTVQTTLWPPAKTQDSLNRNLQSLTERRVII